MLHIDQLRSYSKKPSGKKFAHLIASSKQELHAFAQQCGINKCFFHATPYAHYDVSEDHYAKCVANGANQTTSRNLILIIKGA